MCGCYWRSPLDLCIYVQDDSKVPVHTLGGARYVCDIQGLLNHFPLVRARELGLLKHPVWFVPIVVCNLQWSECINLRLYGYLTISLLFFERQLNPLLLLYRAALFAVLSQRRFICIYVRHGHIRRFPVNIRICLLFFPLFLIASWPKPMWNYTREISNATSTLEGDKWELNRLK
jgi:hypothetical protein